MEILVLNPRPNASFKGKSYKFTEKGRFFLKSVL